MTDEILKHIDKAKRCGEFTTPPNVCAPYLDALRVAVVTLDDMESRCTIETGHFQSTIWDAQEEIAAILGVKEGENAKP